MRLFQNAGIYPAYRPRLRQLCMQAGADRFSAQLDIFLADRYGACHLLDPVLRRAPESFLTNGDDETLQQAWARENGLPAHSTLADILRAQIEHHCTDVFYNMDPMRYGDEFLRTLPGCVRKTIAWRAAPSAGGNFGRHDVLVCNFPGILDTYRAQGLRAEYFSPAHDPEMDAYAASTERPVDVLFIGGYSRHHLQRARILEEVARLHPRSRVKFHLDPGRLTRFAESPLGRLLPLSSHRRPRAIQAVSQLPLFGRELYSAISQSKIVLNGAVDMAGKFRGNMRCFEAMGCGALMVSDEGIYPEGMVPGSTMLTYGDAAQALSTIRGALEQPQRSAEIAAKGARTIRQLYSKSAQWAAFRKIVEAA